MTAFVVIGYVHAALWHANMHTCMRVYVCEHVTAFVVIGYVQRFGACHIIELASERVCVCVCFHTHVHNIYIHTHTYTY